MLQPCVHHHRREASVFESWRPASEAPLSLWQSCDLFPTSGVVPSYVRAAAECQNVALFVSVDCVNGFTQRALLWSETRSDVRWQRWHRRAWPSCAQWGGSGSLGRVLLQWDACCSLSMSWWASEMVVKKLFTCLQRCFWCIEISRGGNMDVQSF